MSDSSNPFKSLLTELKRRRVFRVAGVYAVAAWVVVQVAVTVLPVLDMPEWTIQLIVVLALLGFPVVLALAWAFDVDSHGVKRTLATETARAPSAVPAAAHGRTKLPGGQAGRIAVAGAVVVLALAGAGWWVSEGGSGRDGGAAARSIAVLPFVNMSKNPENEYFSDGITEELLDQLAQLPGLKVAARTSSFAFKGRNVPVPQIARQLGVAVVLEGSVRRAGDRVRITAQLINGETGYHLWSETYDRELTDVFAIQDEIASAIARSLELTLAGGTSGVEATGSRPELAAYDLYLLARHHFHRRGAEPLAEAERLFRAAIAADSSYADAYAGLAMTYAVLPLFDTEAWPVERAVAEGKAAARKALALDPTNARAHAALGQIAQNFEWDWEAAERHYSRAVELNPNDAQVKMWRAEVAVVLGEPDAAAQVERALALDPLSPVGNSIAALAHLLITRDYERSAYFWRQVEELDPRFPLLIEFAPLTFIALERWDEVRHRLLLVASSAADSLAFRTWTDAAAAAQRGTLDGGTRARALAAARLYGERITFPAIGEISLTGPIDANEALDTLVRIASLSRYRHAITWMPHLWFFDPLHGDSRFVALLERLGRSPRPTSPSASSSTRGS